MSSHHSSNSPHNPANSTTAKASGGGAGGGSNNSSNPRLGYVLVLTPQPNTYVGGIMITDNRGLPIEFQYTEPIQPGKIQQILYGHVLSQYIKQEVIFSTLTKHLDSKPTYIFVEDDSLLNIESKVPLFRLAETKAMPLSDVGQTEKLSETELLVQLLKEANPVRLSMPTGKAALNTPPATPSDLTTLLAELTNRLDLCEPFRRVEKALETICQEMGIPPANTSGSSSNSPAGSP